MSLSIFGAVPRLITRSRATFIQQYAFPARVRDGLHRELGLTPEESSRVLEGLRQYFLACLSAQSSPLAREVGMPSKAIDTAWHEFIVDTREYAAFCQRAFGRYLHHNPPGTSPVPSQHALANTLHQFKQPPPSSAAPWIMVGTVPLIFAIDRELGIADGYGYDAEAIASLNSIRYAHMNGKNGSSGSSGGSAGCGGATSCCGVFGSGDGGSSGCSGGGGGGCGGGGCGSS